MTGIDFKICWGESKVLVPCTDDRKMKRFTCTYSIVVGIAKLCVVFVHKILLKYSQTKRKSKACVTVTLKLIGIN